MKIVKKIKRTVVNNTWKRVKLLCVISTGRCGTMTLTNLLGLSRQINSFHERGALLREYQQQCYESAFHTEEPCAKLIQREKASMFSRSFLARKIYCDTSHKFTFFAPVLSESIENSYFLHLCRHPADFVRSAMRRGWYSTHSSDVYRIKPTLGSWAFETWDNLDPFEKNLWYWNEVNKFSLEFEGTVNENRYLRVKSEILFDPASGVTRRIFDLLGIQNPTNEELESVLELKLNAQKTGDYNYLKDWDPGRVEKLVEIAGGTMEKLGYSLP